MLDFFLNYARKATSSAITTFVASAAAAYGISETCTSEVNAVLTTLGAGVVTGAAAWIGTYFPKNQDKAVPVTSVEQDQAKGARTMAKPEIRGKK